jgi:hypothetical protein
LRAIDKKLPFFISQIIEEMYAIEHGVDVFFVIFHALSNDRHDMFLFYGKHDYLWSDDSDGLASWRIEADVIMSEVLLFSQ